MILHTYRRAGGQAIVMLVILLAIFGGGYWWMLNSAHEREKEAQNFARQTAIQLAVHFDQKFLDVRIAPESQTRFPPSFRQRMIGYFRDLGAPSSEIGVEGTVTFTNQFFEPRGQFRAHIQYPDRAADLDLGISNPHGWWQIDDINLTWDLPPAPPPTPTPALEPAAVASPTPER